MRKGEESKGKDGSRGKDGKGDSKGGKTLAKVFEEDRDADASHYSSKTAREDDWGPVNRRREHAYNRWQSENEWEYVGGTWRRKKSPIPDGESEINEDTRKLGFGEYAEWAYVEVLTRKQRYVPDMLGETNSRRPGKKRFIGRIRWGESGIAKGVNTGAVESEVGNLPTFWGGIWILDNSQLVSGGKPF